MKWLINNNILFIPEFRKLTSVKQVDLNIILTTPASRCLMLLLESSPDVVLQEDFFNKVWKEEGMLVPINTLYQNISIVRRGLRTVGETDKKFISTIPRKGFQIDHSVMISRVSEVETEVTETSLSVDIKRLLDDTEEPDSAKPVPEVASKEKSKTDNGYSSSFSVMVIFIAFTTGILAAYFAFNFNNEPSFFSTYTLKETEGDCHFYTNDDTYDYNSNYQKYKSVIKDSGLSCKNYPWIYFSSSKASPVLSALVCKNKITENSPHCISLYFVGVNSD